jgi:glucokinase
VVLHRCRNTKIIKILGDHRSPKAFGGEKHLNIGIDIGGRHVGMGVVDEKGNIINKSIVELDENIDIEYIFASINKYISENSDVKSIGIGVPGLCNGSIIEYTPNLPFKNIDVLNYVKTRLPVYLGNDATCATIAEYNFIDNKMYSEYALVTIGTGIGAGIILNRKVYNGSTGSAGEIGHMVIEKDGLLCNCGRRGCFERYASVSALLRQTKLESLSEVFYLIETNEIVAKIFDSYLENVAEGLANLINLYDLEIVVIGGSIARYESKFIHKLRTKVAERIYNKYTYDLNIKCAKLKNDAGIIGASLLEEYL